MKNLKNKLNKKGGFTLIEMLIVVAIIAILIAVSIPLVSSALERTKIATDAANERSAKAEITIAYLTGEYEDGSKFVADDTYYYDAVNGALVNSGTVTEYGKCTTHKHDGQIIAVKADDKGVVSIAWVADTNGTVAAGDWNKDLCMNEINK